MKAPNVEEIKANVKVNLLMQLTDLLSEKTPDEIHKIIKLIENNPLDLLVKLPIAKMLHGVTRLVVVNWSKDASLEKGDAGRVIDKWNCKVRLVLQDEGKTLKVFYE